MTRRELLALPLLAGAAACHRSPYLQGRFPRAERSPVCLFAVSTYHADLVGVISGGLEALGLDVRGKRVLLKPNLVEYEDHSSINTHPLVVAAAAEAMLRRGAGLVAVGEGPGHRRDTEYLLSATGLFDLLRDLNVPFVDLNHDDVREVPLRAWFGGAQRMLLPVSLLRADVVVSMPKLKTHHWAGMTCGMKNLFGCVPGAVYGWPKNVLHERGIPESILDISATVRPSLTIVDGVVSMEGDGPIKGVPRQLGLLAMGTDVVSVDATCARIIGLDPSKMPYLTEAGRFLGNALPGRIENRGEPPARFATRFAVVERIKPLLAD